MEKIDIKYDIVKECLSKIISYTIWIGSIDLILLYGFFQKQKNLIIGQFSIPSRHIAIYMFFILLYFIISLTHKIDRIQGIFNSLKDNEEKNVIKTYLNLYPSMLNPFAEHGEGERSILLDNLGLGLQSSFYLIGFLLSSKHIIVNNLWTGVISILLLGILYIFRQDLLYLENKMKGIVSEENRRIRRIFHIVFVIIISILNFLLIFIYR
ncbi:MAG TPA: hypothetical protein VFG54_03800 [Prolixibacteraceae bacterium]|nr:hypothetical protein [Prolixibacteraceae bacterium]